MPRITFNQPQVSRPVFTAEPIGEEMVPGGGLLEVADIPVNSTGHKLVLEASLVGRTYAERDLGKGFGPGEVTDDELFLVPFTVRDANYDNGVELLEHFTAVYENRIVGWDTMGDELKAKVRSLYNCQLGAL
jgi:hypothetical protein